MFVQIFGVERDLQKLGIFIKDGINQKSMKIHILKEGSDANKPHAICGMYAVLYSTTANDLFKEWRNKKVNDFCKNCLKKSQQ